MLSEGTIVGSYRVVAKLGEGGGGVIYRAEHTLLERSAAIKVLRPAVSRDEELVLRFFAEAKLVSKLTDPGIVQIYDFGHTESGDAYIVMELLHGETLDRRLTRMGRIAPLEAARLLRLASTSLAAAHEHGIVHRDLKPANLFLVRDRAVPGGERAKILDFGIAKSVELSDSVRTRTGALLGTPVYMSPEQCRGAGGVDARSDVYALGCVAMAMLTGAPPFTPAGLGEVLSAHMNDPPPTLRSRVPELPAAIEIVVQRCLAKAPDDRYPSALDLADALSAIEVELAGASPASSTGTTPSASTASTSAPAAAHVGSQNTLVAASGEQTRVGSRRVRSIGLLSLGVATAAAIGFVAMQVVRGGSQPAANARDSERSEQAPARSIAAPPPFPAAVQSTDAGVAEHAAVAADAGVAPLAIAPAPTPPSRAHGRTRDQRAHADSKPGKATPAASASPQVPAETASPATAAPATIKSSVETQDPHAPPTIKHHDRSD
jgi:serine/threonine-protein kinase